MPDTPEATKHALLVEAQLLRRTAEDLAGKVRIARAQRLSLLAVLVVLAAVVAVLAVLVARAGGETARIDRLVLRGQQVNCAFWYDLAVLPVTAPAGLGLVADGYHSYIGAHCEALYGPLPKPSDALQPYLNKKRGPR